MLLGQSGKPIFTMLPINGAAARYIFGYCLRRYFFLVMIALEELLKRPGRVLRVAATCCTGNAAPAACRRYHNMRLPRAILPPIHFTPRRIIITHYTPRQHHKKRDMRDDFYEFDVALSLMLRVTTNIAGRFTQAQLMQNYERCRLRF